MKHLTAVELSEFVRGETGPGLEGAIRAHLEACGTCRGRRDAAAALERALRSMPADRPSGDFTPRLLSRLGLRGAGRGEASEPLPLGWLFLRNFAPIAAAAVIAVAVMTLGAGGGEHTGQAPGSYDPATALGAIRGFLRELGTRLSGMASGALSADGGMDALSVGTMLTLLLGSVSLLDRFVLGPMFRRRH